MPILHKWAAQVDSEMAIFKLFVNMCNRGRFDLRCNSNQGSILAYKQSMDIELRRVQQSVARPKIPMYDIPAAQILASAREHPLCRTRGLWCGHSHARVSRNDMKCISVYPTLVHVNEVQGIKLLNIRVNAGNLILNIKLHCISFS